MDDDLVPSHWKIHLIPSKPLILILSICINPVSLLSALWQGELPWQQIVLVCRDFETMYNQLFRRYISVELFNPLSTVATFFTEPT